MIIFLLYSQIGNEGLAADLTDDPDTEEALKEFDFLVTAEDGEGAGEARSSGDGTEWGKVVKKFGVGGNLAFQGELLLKLMQDMCI
jgi:striatin 1/3/4